MSSFNAFGASPRRSSCVVQGMARLCKPQKTNNKHKKVTCLTHNNAAYVPAHTVHAHAPLGWK